MPALESAAVKTCDDCTRSFIVDNTVLPTPQLTCPYCAGENTSHDGYVELGA